MPADDSDNKTGVLSAWIATHLSPGTSPTKRRPVIKIDEGDGEIQADSKKQSTLTRIQLKVRDKISTPTKDSEYDKSSGPSGLSRNQLTVQNTSPTNPGIEKHEGI